MGSNKEHQPKEKYPLLGTTPPRVEHCGKEHLVRGGNNWMIWWDCDKCFNRVMDISMKKPEEVRYYSVPPCPNSPNWVHGMMIPKLAVKKEVRPETPPVNLTQQSKIKDTGVPPINLFAFRKVQETPKYTPEEELILKEAQKIVQRKGSPATGSNDDALYAKAVTTPTPLTPKAPNKREGPSLFQFGKGPDAMKTEEDFLVINPVLEAMDDSQILEELAKLEEMANALKLTLQNRVTKQ